MMFRSKKVAGLALAVASVTALAACSSSGSGSGGGNNNNDSSSTVKVPGGIGSIPVAAAGAKIKAGTITWAMQPGAVPNWIFPVIPTANNSVYNAFTFIYEMWRPLYWQVNGVVPEIDPNHERGQRAGVEQRQQDADDQHEEQLQVVGRQAADRR